MCHYVQSYIYQTYLLLILHVHTFNSTLNSKFKYMSFKIKTIEVQCTAECALEFIDRYCR